MIFNGFCHAFWLHDVGIGCGWMIWKCQDQCHILPEMLDHFRGSEILFAIPFREKWHLDIVFQSKKKNCDPKSPWMFIIRDDIFSCGFNSPQNVAPVSLRKVSFRMKRVDFFFIQNVSIFVAESGPQIILGTMNETLWFFRWIWPLTFFNQVMPGGFYGVKSLGSGTLKTHVSNRLF